MIVNPISIVSKSYHSKLLKEVLKYLLFQKQYPIKIKSFRIWKLISNHNSKRVNKNMTQTSNKFKLYNKKRWLLKLKKWNRKSMNSANQVKKLWMIKMNKLINLSKIKKYIKQKWQNKKMNYKSNQFSYQIPKIKTKSSNWILLIKKN